jgi:hypothetical protein
MKLFHVSRKPDLTELRPSRFDAFGRMPEKAVFVTTQEFVRRWAGYVGECIRPVYVYEILLTNPKLDEGVEGWETGDLKIVTNDPIPVEFL